MENLNFNNNLKIEEEKTPQENMESLSAEEQESGKRENTTLEIDGQKIEVTKYYFEYPEQIQKETGILGYDRMKISKSDLEKINLRKTLLNLSDGNYPNHCFLHQFAGYAGDQSTEIYLDSFLKDRFFLQKIYSLDTADRIIKEEKFENIRPQYGEPSMLFDHGNYANKNHFVFYKKDSTQKQVHRVPNIEHIIEGGSTNVYRNELNNNSYARTGLNVFVGDLPTEHGGMDILKTQKPIFGFSMNSQDLFSKYLEKDAEISFSNFHKGTDAFSGPKQDDISKRRFDKIDSVNERKKGFDAILFNLMIKMKSIQETKDNIENYTDEALEEIINEALIKLETKYNFIAEESFQQTLSHPQFGKYNKRTDNLLSFKRQILSYIKGDIFETEIPVLINNDDVPQLSWGHTKYAHYANKKGLNFFKFKHSDHLPTKHEEDPSVDL